MKQLLSQWAPWIWCLLGFILYVQTVPFGFVLDDQVVYSENSFVQKGVSGIPDIISNEGFVGYFGEKRDLVIGDRYRPLSLVTFAIEKEIIGGKPWIGHLNNALLYGILCALVFIFLRKMAAALGSRSSEAVAWVAAACFTLHPVHVEAVANIKGRDEILAALFFVLVLWISARWKDSFSYLGAAMIAILTFLGIMSKEHVVTLLAILPLTEWLIFKSSWKKIMFVTLAVLVGVVAYLALRNQVLGYLIPSAPSVTGDLMNNPFLEMEGEEVGGTIIFTWLRYFLLLWFPFPLTHDYYPYHIAKYSMGDGIVILTIILYLSLAITAFWNWRKRPIGLWSLAVFAITLLPASNIFFTVGTFMNERFLFLPSLGFAAFFGMIFGGFWNHRQPAIKGLMRIVPVAILSFFLFVTLFRIPDWRSGHSLNQSAIKVSKNSARINLFVGTDHFNEANKLTDRREKMAQLDRAEQYLQKALRIYPLYGSANNMLCGTCAEKYKIDNKLSALLKCFERVATFRPDTEYLNQFLDFLKQRGDVGPELIDFYRRLGYKRLYTERKNFPYALKYLRTANDLNPGNKEIYRELSEVYMAFGIHLQEHPDPNFPTSDIIDSGRFFGEKAR